MLETLTSEWLNLVLRWVHITVGIAWIGSSFLFVWMDSHLRPGETPKPGVYGELWMVHGGGFYHLEKYTVAPAKLPKTLHWFMWESYSTWLSGFALLVLIYFIGAETYLLRPGSGFDAVDGTAIAIAILLGGWLLYDGLCRLMEGRSTALLGALVFAAITAAAWGMTQIFSGRGAFIMTGAMIGTIMSANVFRIIIPNQRIAVAAMMRGEAPEARLGMQARQRSLHNSYLTLPLLFTMISNHYAAVFGHAWNWLILAGLGVIGALVRHAFISRNRGQPVPWLLPGAAVAMLTLAFVATPRALPGAGDGAQAAAVPFHQVADIMEKRCTACHAARPTFEGFQAPPKGVVLDSPASIRNEAKRIYAQSVATDAMPIGNATQMTPEERTLIGEWVRQGAKIEP
ncbi:MAG TPA: urate hydroxylase PuuD [Alphaproteobacteria bacterium]|nr:urate hydroxylase PuuD [Alphaproteobacteria bacterium]